MTDTNESAVSTESTDPSSQETASSDGTDETPDLAAELDKWKALARKQEARAKENAEAAKKLAEIEDAEKTESQRLAEQLEQLKGENETLRISNLRSDVAASKGVPAALLTGSTKEELEEAADALLTFKGETPKAPSSEGQGKVGSSVSEGSEPDINTLLRAAARK